MVRTGIPGYSGPIPDPPDPDPDPPEDDDDDFGRGDTPDDVMEPDPPDPDPPDDDDDDLGRGDTPDDVMEPDPPDDDPDPEEEFGEEIGGDPADQPPDDDPGRGQTPDEVMEPEPTETRVEGGDVRLGILAGDETPRTQGPSDLGPIDYPDFRDEQGLEETAGGATGMGLEEAGGTDEQFVGTIGGEEFTGTEREFAQRVEAQAIADTSLTGEDVVVQRGDEGGFTVAVTEEARRSRAQETEQQFLAENPDFEPEDVAVTEEGIEFTRRSRDVFAERELEFREEVRAEAEQELEQQFQEQGFDVDVIEDDVTLREEDGTVTYEPSERLEQRVDELEQERAQTQAEQNLEDEVGMDLERGEDFTFEETDEGTRATPTESFQREQATMQLEKQATERTGRDIDLDTGDVRREDGEFVLTGEARTAVALQDRQGVAGTVVGATAAGVTAWTQTGQEIASQVTAGETGEYWAGRIDPDVVETLGDTEGWLDEGQEETLREIRDQAGTGYVEAGEAAEAAVDDTGAPGFAGDVVRGVGEFGGGLAEAGPSAALLTDTAVEAAQQAPEAVEQEGAVATAGTVGAVAGLVGASLITETARDPGGAIGEAAAGFGAGTAGVRAIERGAEVARGGYTQLRADRSTVELEEITTSEAEVRAGENPTFDTGKDAPAGEAADEVRTRAGDNPPEIAPGEADDALFHTTGSRFDRDLEVGWYEVPPCARRHIAKPLIRGGFDAPIHPER